MDPKRRFERIRKAFNQMMAGDRQQFQALSARLVELELQLQSLTNFLNYNSADPLLQSLGAKRLASLSEEATNLQEVVRRLGDSIAQYRKQIELVDKHILKAAADEQRTQLQMDLMERLASPQVRYKLDI